MRRSRRQRTVVRSAGLSALFARVLDSHYAVFTAGNIDSTGGVLNAWIDWKDPTHTLVGSATKCALPAGHADFGGGLCATFTGLQTYTSNRAAATWAFLTGGAGVEIAAAISPTSVAGNQMYIATNTSGAGPGWLWFQGAGTPSFGARKTGGTVIVLQSPGALTTQPYIFQQRHATAEDPDASVKKTGSVAVTGNYASAADAVTPGGSFTLGGTPIGTFPISARAHSLLIANKILSAQERADRDAWLLAATTLAT